MKTSSNLTLTTVLLGMTSLATADFSNGSDPYSPDLGFRTPDQAVWGGWTRGDDGTHYAEWDLFIDSAVHGERTATPDIGQQSANDIHLQWNPGTFVTSTGNLYSFSVPQQFTIRLPELNATNALRAVLQLETQGPQIDYDGVKLNGRQPDFNAVAFIDTEFETVAGKTELVHNVFYWDLSESDTELVFRFDGSAHMSLSQVAVDVGGPEQQQASVDIDRGVLTVPCADVRKSPFDGHYQVSLNTTTAGDIQNWKVAGAKKASCETSDAPMPTHRLLQSTGLLETRMIENEDNAQINRNRIADFAYRLFLIPCVEVSNASATAQYHVALEMANDSGLDWSLKDVVKADINECRDE